MYRNFYKTLGYSFKNEKLLNSALLHSSISGKHSKFERLEFLGDRILGLAVSEYIFYHQKQATAGRMMQVFASCVCCETCAKIAKEIGVPNIIKTAQTKLKNNTSVLGDAMEAIIAAVFLDSNFEQTRGIIWNLWKTYLVAKKAEDYKTVLQEITQSVDKSTPIYDVISITGTEHNPTFTVQVSALGYIANGSGHNKKAAEINAAKALIKIIGK